ncbi:MAG: DNA polymerase IV [Desulfobacteraceae bacterium]|nr:DNA polymerase IV [Desulfobacteraceae bacterium]
MERKDVNLSTLLKITERRHHPCAGARVRYDTPQASPARRTAAANISQANMTANRERRIIHLDMDAFYASVEVLDQPALRGRPVIVGGGSERGVVSAASYEARRFGVHSALPIATARRLCPEGVFLPVRMERYREVSARIMEIFRRYTPLVEPLSLDEAFLDVTGSRPLFGPAEEIARTIKELVRTEIGLTVSAGVAGSKLVAKIASDLRKPDGLTLVPPGGEREFLANLPIGKLWGVGQASREALGLMGVRTIGDLGRLPLSLLEGKFGKHGRHLHEAALGIDNREVEPEREMKSVGHEETFAADLTRRQDLERELLALAVRVGRRLRRYGVRGRTVTLKVKYHDFKQVTRSATLTAATDDEGEICREAGELLARTEAGRKPVRLLGISLANLAEAGAARQLDLFAPGHGQAKKEGLHRALDAINDKYGSRSILPAALMEGEEEK